MNQAVIPKGVLLVVAVITMAVGLYSHYSSDWSGYKRGDLEAKGDEAPFHMCDDWPSKDECTSGSAPACDVLMLLLGVKLEGCENFGSLEVDTCAKCPKIGLERFFVAMSIIGVIGAVVSLALSFVGNKDNAALKYGDIGMNMVLAILVLIASVLYIVSAVQIHKLLEGFDEFFEAVQKLLQLAGLDVDLKIKQRHGAKIAAAVIGILQSLLHVGVGAMGFRG